MDPMEITIVVCGQSAQDLCHRLKVLRRLLLLFEVVLFDVIKLDTRQFIDPDIANNTLQEKLKARQEITSIMGV